MANDTPPVIDFATDPSRYRHWRLVTGSAVAELVLDVDETGATSARDIGKVMGRALRELGGKADGRRINEIARELLAGPSG